MASKGGWNTAIGAPAAIGPPRCWGSHHEILSATEVSRWIQPILRHRAGICISRTSGCAYCGISPDLQRHSLSTNGHNKVFVGRQQPKLTQKAFRTSQHFRKVATPFLESWSFQPRGSRVRKACQHWKEWRWSWSVSYIRYEWVAWFSCPII